MFGNFEILVRLNKGYAGRLTILHQVQTGLRFYLKGPIITKIYNWATEQMILLGRLDPAYRS